MILVQEMQRLDSGVPVGAKKQCTSLIFRAETPISPFRQCTRITQLFHLLSALTAFFTNSELARQIRYLKEENKDKNPVGRPRTSQVLWELVIKIATETGFGELRRSVKNA